MRIAIVSDPLVQRGGAERVVEAMATAFPQAPIFAVLYSPERGPSALAERVRTSPLARIPGAARRHRWLLPWYPQAVESFDLRDFDVVLSSHHTAAKGIVRHADMVHVCYCHTPMRALWEWPARELATWPALARPVAASLLHDLRVWDYATAARVDHFLANSETTRRRIAKHYGRESEVLHPPIDVERFTPHGDAGDYYLVASRMVPYKRVDLAVHATGLVSRRLVVVGGGRPDPSLRAPHVEYRGHVSDAELIALMRGARALIFPQYEDFGMTPLEMMACGRPVIAYGRGGAAETVVDGVTGVLVDDQSADAFARAILRFERLRFAPQAARAHAEGFSRERFVSRLREAVALAVDRDAMPPMRYAAADR